MKVSRREFMQAGLATVALPLAAAANAPRVERRLIVNMIGGPSQHETWDPKPNAPSGVRGPFKDRATNVVGIRIGELFPRLATLADRYAIVRSVHHDAAPIHETGLQLLETGRLHRPDDLLIPGPLEWLGVSTAQAPPAPSPRILPEFRYGPHPFGRLLSEARQHLERGASSVTVNLFTALYDRVTWDCHADGYCLNSTLEDYRATLCPAFDQAFAMLLDDLSATGMLDTTLVVAQGEMGRTPYLNDRGGRDHWPAVWSVLLAGGGIEGGQVIGSSDALGGEPRDAPIHASSLWLAATRRGARTESHLRNA